MRNAKGYKLVRKRDYSKHTSLSEMMQLITTVEGANTIYDTALTLKGISSGTLAKLRKIYHKRFPGHRVFGS